MTLRQITKEQQKMKKLNNLYSIPKNAFEAPLKYRFTFVPEGSTYYSAAVVQISEKITSERKAFYIACETFLKNSVDKKIKNIAIFYGDVNTPDYKDKLYRTYCDFNSTVRK